MKMKWLTIESLWHIEDLVVSSWAVWGWTSRWSSSEWWLTPWRMTSSRRWSSICGSSWSPNDLWGRYSSHEMPLVISDFGVPSIWWWTRTRMTSISYNPPSSSTWSSWPPTRSNQLKMISWLSVDPKEIKTRRRWSPTLTPRPPALPTHPPPIQRPSLRGESLSRWIFKKYLIKKKYSYHIHKSSSLALKLVSLKA